MTLKELANEIAGGSRLTLNRQAVTTDAIRDMPLTLRDYDVRQVADGDGIVKEYAICTFDELPAAYYNAGKQLTDICKGIEANGMHDTLTRDGLKIQLEPKRTMTGRNFTAVKLLE